MPYPSVTPLPTPPNPSAPATFNTLAYPFTQAQVTLAAQINALVTQLNATFFPASPVLAMTPGTAAAPVYSRDGDPNTGMFFPAADTIAFTTNGVEKLRITSAGLLTSSTALSQSSTDSTAGRIPVMTLNGIFGLGAANEHPAMVNLDDATRPTGFYRTNTGGTTGTWPAAAGAMTVLHQRIVGGSVKQTATYGVGATFGQTYQRVYSHATAAWLPWERVITAAALLGTVSFDMSGVPSGALWQPVVSANGRSERNASGGQRCHRSDLSAASVSTASGSRFVSANITWTFPAAFRAGTVPAVVLQAIDPDCDIRVVSITPTAVVFRVISDVSKATAVAVTGISDGVW